MPNKAAQILLKKYEESRSKNIHWSKRAFAQKLGISSGALSEILTGKRNLSSVAKKKMAAKLQLSPKEQIDFFAEELPEHLKHPRLDYLQLSEDQFRIISDWSHYAILNLIKTLDFKPFPNWMAQRLGIKPSVAEEALERLLRLGFLHKDKKGHLFRKNPRLESSDDILDPSVQRSHLEDLKLIERSLLTVPVHLRDHTSMTVVIKKKDLPKAKEMIRIFQDTFSQAIEPEMGDEVYKLCIGFFPLTIQEPT